MLKRVISGAVLLVLALAFILTGGKLLGVVCAVLSMTAYRELMRACKVEKWGKCGLLETTGYAGILLYYMIMILSGDFSWALASLVFVFLLQMAVYVFKFPGYQAQQVQAAFFNVFYACVPFSFVFLTRQLEHGIYLVWLIFVSSWVCDTCAYFAGVTLGKHKLAPVLSPKKSVEGAIGGVIGSIAVGVLFAWIFLVPVTGKTSMIWAVACISGAGAVISQIGDLAASAIKRNHDIKDYGKLIPGHGGIMDRFDSVLFTAPIIYYLSVLFMEVL